MNKQILLFTAVMMLSGNALFAAAKADEAPHSLAEAKVFLTSAPIQAQNILQALDIYQTNLNREVLADTLNKTVPKRDDCTCGAHSQSDPFYRTYLVIAYARTFFLSLLEGPAPAGLSDQEFKEFQKLIIQADVPAAKVIERLTPLVEKFLLTTSPSSNELY